jgi:cobalt/nickel transport system ATP-binding protein
VLVNLIQQLGGTGKTSITATHELEIVPFIANRVVVFGEERRMLADGTPESILRNRDLLVQANLIHEHLHPYGATQVDENGVLTEEEFMRCEPGRGRIALVGERLITR